jgi:hypothetical protein
LRDEKVTREGRHGREQVKGGFWEAPRPLAIRKTPPHPTLPAQRGLKDASGLDLLGLGHFFRPSLHG